VVSAAGVGRAALARATAAVGVAPGGDAAAAPALWLDPRTRDELGLGVPGFSARELLGRRGTSFLDRATALALVACAEAIEDSALVPSAERIGVSLGTSTGSLRSMSDYTRETLIEERPYLVNPALFPNTVMNCAAGQSAIRFGLRGINATIAGGALAFLAVLHVSGRSLRLGHVDAVLAGAVEELSPQRVAHTAAVRADLAAPPGEGAAVVALEPAARAAREGRTPDALLEAAALGFAPGGERGDALPWVFEERIEHVLARAGVEPSEVHSVACAIPSDTVCPGLGEQAVSAALKGHLPEWLDLNGLIGDCGAATGALQAAALLLRHRAEPDRDGQRSLLVGWTAEGAVGAALIRGHNRSVS
jgi:3-oxoacyl-[acyl-carrier-protein] synthase II